jgi:hypothetical protein
MSSESSIGGEINSHLFFEITDEMSTILFKEDREQGRSLLRTILTGHTDIIEMIPLLPITEDFDPATVPVVAGGTYGKIYTSNAWKTNPDEDYKSVIGKMMKHGSEIGFLEENLTHLLLYLLYEKRNLFINHNVFPEIYGMYRTDGTNSPKSVIVIMEKVPNDFYTVFLYKNVIGQIDQIIVLASFLADLQYKQGFIHGDMHYGNIMLTRDTVPDIKIGMEDGVKIINANLPYIIDLGRACINLTSGRKMIVKISDDSSTTLDSYEHCTNKSYDMRIFIASILDFMDEPLKSFFIQKFRKYERYRFESESYFHNFYKSGWNDTRGFSPDKEVDEDFIPVSLITKLFKLKEDLGKDMVDI